MMMPGSSSHETIFQSFLFFKVAGTSFFSDLLIVQPDTPGHEGNTNSQGMTVEAGPGAMTAAFNRFGHIKRVHVHAPAWLLRCCSCLSISSRVVGSKSLNHFLRCQLSINIHWGILTVEQPQVKVPASRSAMTRPLQTPQSFFLKYRFNVFFSWLVFELLSAGRLLPGGRVLCQSCS